MELNTMESFNKEGFKIVRDGKVITLTSEEMSDFRYMDKAQTGSYSLDFVLDNNKIDISDEMKEKMVNDVHLCAGITENIEELLYEDCGALENDVTLFHIKKYIEEQEKSLDKDKSIE